MVSGNNPGGNNPDEKTIVFNQDGDIQVAPETIILGDFENNSTGSWSGDGSPLDNDVGADGTNYYWRIFNFNNGNYSFSRSFDLTGVETLIFHMRISSDTGTSNDEARFEIGGTTFASLTGGGSTSWKQYETDVSSLSGSKTLKGVMDLNSGSNFGVYFDRIIAIRPSNAGGETGDGAGGTA